MSNDKANRNMEHLPQSIFFNKKNTTSGQNLPSLRWHCGGANFCRDESTSSEVSCHSQNISSVTSASGHSASSSKQLFKHSSSFWLISGYLDKNEVLSCSPTMPSAAKIAWQGWQTNHGDCLCVWEHKSARVEQRSPTSCTALNTWEWRSVVLCRWARKSDENDFTTARDSCRFLSRVSKRVV